MGQMGGFTDAQIQMSKRDNYSLAKLFLIHMGRVSPKKQTKVYKASFSQRLEGE